MLTDTQRAVYRAWRKPAPWMRATPAGALFAARENRYPKQVVGSSGHRGLNGKSVIQYWDNRAAVPFRFVGYADELIRSIDHQGWYSDTFQDATLRGAVFRLPARNGQTRYLYGYEESDSGSVVLYRDIETDERDAALAADGRAERIAETSREYDEAWHAGSDAADKVREALAALRDEVSRIVQIALYPDRIGLTVDDDAGADRQHEEARDKLVSAIRAARDSQPTYSKDLLDAWREGFDGSTTIKAIGGRIEI
jgi:hypothetical protein